MTFPLFLLVVGEYDDEWVQRSNQAHHDGTSSKSDTAAQASRRPARTPTGNPNQRQGEAPIPDMGLEADIARVAGVAQDDDVGHFELVRSDL